MQSQSYFRPCGWLAAAPAAVLLGICCLPAWAQTNYSYYDPAKNAGSAPSSTAPAKPGAPAAAANQAPACYSSQQSSVGGAVNETTCSQTKDGRKLESKSIQLSTAAGGPGSSYQEKDETVQVGPDTTRTVKTLLAPDADGYMRPIRVTVEETRQLPGGKESVVRTVSTPDLNGQLHVAQKEVSQTTPKGPGEQETHTTLLMPGSNGQLAPVIKTDQIEQKKGDEVQIRATQSRPDANGGWAPSLVQETVRKPGKDGSTTEEQKLYQPGLGGKLQLSRRKLTRQWTDKKGAQQSVEETYSGNAPGANHDAGGQLGLAERVSTTRKPGKNGAQEVRQKIETSNYGAPWAGLTVSGQVDETIRPAGNGRVETDQKVYAPNGNGRLSQISVFTGQAPAEQAAQPEKKQPEKKPQEIKAQEKIAQPSAKGKGRAHSAKGKQK
jgi:hypothetical protein